MKMLSNKESKKRSSLLIGTVYFYLNWRVKKTEFSKLSKLIMIFSILIPFSPHSAVKPSLPPPHNPPSTLPRTKRLKRDSTSKLPLVRLHLCREKELRRRIMNTLWSRETSLGLLSRRQWEQHSAKFWCRRLRWMNWGFYFLLRDHVSSGIASTSVPSSWCLSLHYFLLCSFFSVSRNCSEIRLYE